MHKNIFFTKHLVTLLFAVVINASFVFGQNSFTPLADDTISVTKDTSYIADKGELKLNWNAVAGAEFYQLEWTWVDNYSDNLNNASLSANLIKFSDSDFNRNNTRIETQESTYNVPLTYGQGFLLFRVRALGYFSVAKKSYKHTKWSTFTTQDKSVISDWDVNVNGYEIKTGHFTNLNWQYQSSFAEEGKKKEVVSYFDGTLRNRQTVTKINTDKHVVVGEVIYDAQGRPAVEVLPVPIENQKIGYQTNFTLNNNSTPQVYNYNDFDTDSDNELDRFTPAKAMSNTSGASKYYSSNNDVTSIHNDYIPNAKLYPFSQIEYTADNTGRIKRKSGVGITHQLGNGQEMEYYYGTPSQKELNRLFGYSVGKASHYKKNLVLDPNNQASVSYIDPQGRTIATALVASSPDNLDGLEDEKAGEALHKLIADDFFVSDNDTEENSNIKSASQNYGNVSDQTNFSASKLSIKDNEKYTFTYKIEPLPALNYECYDNIESIFDVVVEARDRDQKLLFREERSVEGGKGDEIIKEDVVINRGSFSVAKRLILNKEKLEEEADKFITKLQDDSDLECFVDNSDAFFLPPILQEGCYTSCEECTNDLFGLDDNGIQITNRNIATNRYVDNLMVNYDFSTEENLSDREKAIETQRLRDLFTQQFNEIIDLCNGPCEVPLNDDSISCQIIEGELLEDMKPFGQYGFNTSNISASLLNSVSSMRLNVFNEQNELFSTRTGNEIHNSWRNPSHPEFDSSSTTPNLNTSGHYYNSDGSISYVTIKITREIEFVEGTNSDNEEEVTEEETLSFSPEIPLDLFTESELEGKSEIEVEPHYLLNVSDFVSEAIWQDSWAASLLKYHPEYAYLEYSKSECSRTATVEGKLMNSDAFDLYINGISTYEEALEKNIITSAAGSGDLYRIASLDPYFSAISNTDTANNRSKIIQEALEENFDGTSGPMMSYALGLVICNSISPCDALDAAISGNYTEKEMLDIVNERSVEDQNRFWNVYKTNYLAVKQRIQTVFSNLYATQQNGYNGCIGNKPAPTSITDIIIDYKDSTLNAIENQISGGLSICDDTYKNEYNTKKKRYIAADSEYNSSADPEEALEQIKRETKHDYYVATGTCPLGLDMELFLDFYFKETQPDLITKIDAIRDLEYSGQYLSIDLFQELGGIYPQPAGTSFNMVGESQSPYRDLSISLDTSDAEFNRKPTILKLQYLPANVGSINWNNYNTAWTINQITRFYYTNYNATSKLFTFEVLAKIETLPGKIYEEVIISGTTQARVGECSIDQANGIGEFLPPGPGLSSETSCTKERDFNSAMTSLIAELVQENTVNSNNRDLSNVPEYTNSYLASFLGNTNPVWIANGSTYKIEVNGQIKAQINLDRQLSSTATAGIRNFSTNYQEAANGGIEAQNVVISYGRRRGGSATQNRLLGTLTQDGTRLINLLCCGDINDSVGIEITNDSCNILENLVDGTFETSKDVATTGVEYDFKTSRDKRFFRQEWTDQGNISLMLPPIQQPMFFNSSRSKSVNSYQMGESPQGGVFLTSILQTNRTNPNKLTYRASFYKVLDNLDTSRKYKVSFYQANSGITNTNGTTLTNSGFDIGWRVKIDEQIFESNPIPYDGYGNQKWEYVEFEFQPTKSTHTINFIPYTPDLDDSGVISGGGYTAACAAIDDVKIGKVIEVECNEAPICEGFDDNLLRRWAGELKNLLDAVETYNNSVPVDQRSDNQPIQLINFPEWTPFLQNFYTKQQIYYSDFFYTKSKNKRHYTRNLPYVYDFRENNPEVYIFDDYIFFSNLFEIRLNPSAIDKLLTGEPYDRNARTGLIFLDSPFSLPSRKRTGYGHKGGDTCPLRFTCGIENISSSYVKIIKSSSQYYPNQKYNVLSEDVKEQSFEDEIKKLLNSFYQSSNNEKSNNFKTAAKLFGDDLDGNHYDFLTKLDNIPFQTTPNGTITPIEELDNLGKEYFNADKLATANRDAAPYSDSYIIPRITFRKENQELVDEVDFVASVVFSRHNTIDALANLADFNEDSIKEIMNVDIVSAGDSSRLIYNGIVFNIDYIDRQTGLRKRLNNCFISIYSATGKDGVFEEGKSNAVKRYFLNDILDSENIVVTNTLNRVGRLSESEAEFYERLLTPTPTSSISPCAEAQDFCIPQPVKPVSCSNKFSKYTSLLNQLGNPADVTVDKEDFCESNLAYLVDNYEYYLTTMGVLSSSEADKTDDLYYISIERFGATPFNYGYTGLQGSRGMLDIIDAYKAEIDGLTNTDIIPPPAWGSFAISYYNGNESEELVACAPLALPQDFNNDNISIPTPDKDECTQFKESIRLAYQRDNYTSFLGRKREDFVNHYLNFTMNNLDETFTLGYFDKEYQYTLYYYDQAGNLQQTVPPEGVDRFEEDELEAAGINEEINQYRNSPIPLAAREDLLPDHSLKTQYKYNTLNQLIWQKTPDGGITQFAYDKLGRIFLSQNAKQYVYNSLNRSFLYSYTKYDGLGRIVEAGELESSEVINIRGAGFVNGRFVGHNSKPIDKIEDLKSLNNKKQVTITKYTEGLTDPQNYFKTFKNKSEYESVIRNRVSGIYYYENYSVGTPESAYNNAIYYNYDIHGNVKEIVQHNKAMDTDPNIFYSGAKHVSYEYDLISGNVNKVTYEKGCADQFIHRYTYDADNRITMVQTSSDGITWEKDAKYQYYAHGPLARVLIGEREVQAMDYVYTLQGWLKGVNSEDVDINKIESVGDIGGDGINNNVATDAFAYSLSYYNGDYAPLSGQNPFTVSESQGPVNQNNLYNGNIKTMVTSLLNTNEQPLGTLKNNYTYDQLNRIKSFNGIDLSSGTANPLYSASYNYDKNGNLEQLSRTYNGTTFDNFNYKYNQDGQENNSQKVNNQLLTVQDTEGKKLDNDLIDQFAALGIPQEAFDPNNTSHHNYVYDEIGQLIEDKSEGLKIEWRVDGKVANIDKGNNQKITFEYDGLGNRIGKIEANGTNIVKQTYYTRDAQGNVMAVYGEGGSTTVVNNTPVDVEVNVVESNENDVFALNTITTTTTIAAGQTLNFTAGQSITLAPGFEATQGSNSLLKIEEAPTTTETEVEIAEGFFLKEQHIYGSSRLGLVQQNKLIVAQNTEATNAEIGNKRYELSNHLGNVLSVITDKKLTNADGTFSPDVIAFNDYYPFGMLLPNRHGSSDKYRYGYQGSEKDDEIKGEGNSLNFAARMYDPRIARWKSRDRYEAKYTDMSPYSFSLNSPMVFNDKSGDTVKIKVTNKKVGTTKINLFSSSEIKNSKGKLKQKTITVPVYEVQITNESGSSATFYFTREAFRGNKDKPKAEPIDVTFDPLEEGEAFFGKIRSRWSGTDNVLEVTPLSGKRKDGYLSYKGLGSKREKLIRKYVQFHLKGASDGCLLCVGSGQFESKEKGVTLVTKDLSSNSGNSMKNFMSKIKLFQGEDVEAGKSDIISVNFDMVESAKSNKDNTSSTDNSTYTININKFEAAFKALDVSITREVREKIENYIEQLNSSSENPE